MSIEFEKSSFKEQPRSRLKGRWPLGLALAAAIATGALVIPRLTSKPPPQPAVSKTPVATHVITSLGRLEPRGEVIQLSGPSTTQGQARVEKLLVKEGERVKAGQAIAILDSYSRLQTALEAAKRQVDVDRANLAKVQAGAKQGEIAAQRATIANLKSQLQGEIATEQATLARQEAQLKRQAESQTATLARMNAQRRNAETDAQRYQSLYQSGAISASDVDTRRLNAETAIRQVDEAQANLNQSLETLSQQVKETKATRNKNVASLQRQIEQAEATLNQIAEVRPTDVQAARAQVERSIAAVNQAEADLDLAYVRSPSNGQIIKIHTWPGETVSSKGIAEMGQTAEMVAVAEVNEDDIGKVHLGQRATITSDYGAFTEELKGTVSEVGFQVSKQDVLKTDPAADVDARVVEVKIRLTPEASKQVERLTYAKIKAAIQI